MAASGGTLDVGPGGGGDHVPRLVSPSAARAAGMGAAITWRGGRAALAWSTMRASTGQPLLSARALEATSTAAPPSLSWLELPAVDRPGRRRGTLARAPR